MARQAGVSRSTVSLVLRGSTATAARTRARVAAAIQDLGYVYNRDAAALRSRRSQTIGLIVCQITEPFYAALTEGVDARLDRAGWAAFLANSGEGLERQDRFIRRMREHNVDGIILCPVEDTPIDLLDRLRSWQLPCVPVLRRISDDNHDFVGADHQRGTELVTEHVIGLGHRRIAFVGGLRKASVVRDRIAGYQAALRRHGIPFDESLVVLCPSTRRAGAEAIATLLDRPAAPTAVIGFNDSVALGVMLGLHDRGLRPGHDIAVVGFDDIEDAATSRPTLTTVAIDPHAIGQAAAELLLRRIATPDAPAQSFVTAPRLVVRDSCGGARAARSHGPRRSETAGGPVATAVPSSV